MQATVFFSQKLSEKRLFNRLKKPEKLSLSPSLSLNLSLSSLLPLVAGGGVAIKGVGGGGISRRGTLKWCGKCTGKCCWVGGGGGGGGGLVIGEVDGRRRLLQGARRLLLILIQELLHHHVVVLIPRLVPLLLQVLDDVGLEELATLQKKSKKKVKKGQKRR